jgi:predicted RNase H-like nuclease
MYIGADGYRRGWVAVYIDEAGGHYFEHSSSLDELLAVPHTRAMIDLPVGLPDRGKLRDVITSMPPARQAELRGPIPSWSFGAWPVTFSIARKANPANTGSNY